MLITMGTVIVWPTVGVAFDGVAVDVTVPDNAKTGALPIIVTPNTSATITSNRQ